MCRKNPRDCTVKAKCKCCKEKLDSNCKLQGISKKFGVAIEQKDDTLNLNEVDSMFEQQHYMIEIKGE